MSCVECRSRLRDIMVTESLFRPFPLSRSRASRSVMRVLQEAACSLQSHQPAETLQNGWEPRSSVAVSIASCTPSSRQVVLDIDVPQVDQMPTDE